MNTVDEYDKLVDDRYLCIMNSHIFETVDIEINEKENTKKIFRKCKRCWYCQVLMLPTHKHN